MLNKSIYEIKCYSPKQKANCCPLFVKTGFRSSSSFSKTFRIWRIFKSPFDQKIITNIELFIHWLILLIPAIIILILSMMIIATPSAQLRNHQSYDDLECSSAGLSGLPLAIIFFFIFVAYAALLLLFWRISFFCYTQCSISLQ